MEQPNLKYIDELAGNNAEFRAKLIEILKRELPFEIRQYEEAINKNDCLHAAELVHKLKHKISFLGLEKSYYLAVNYEDNLIDGTVTLQAEFEGILETMQEFVIYL